MQTLAGSPGAVKGSKDECPIVYAVPNRCLWRRPSVGGAIEDTSAELHSLSPSDAAIKKSMEMIDFRRFWTATC